MNNIPPDTIRSIRDYVDFGLNPGGFLTAVLSNNLFESIAYADNKNAPVLTDIVKYIYNHTPNECWGTKAKVDIWLHRKMEERATKV